MRTFLFFFLALSIPLLSQAAETEVHLVEDHSEALAIWAKSGLKGLTVLHVDAHDDLWPAPSADRLDRIRGLVGSGRFSELRQRCRYYADRERRLCTINNFLVPASRLGIVKGVSWAYPFPDRPDGAALERLRDELAVRGARRYPAIVEDLTADPPRMTGTLSGVPITIGALEDLFPAGQPVLLDVDLDFFAPFYKTPASSSFLRLLGGFVRFLEEREIETPLAVIAYSHNGGYLPIEYRFIGSWLKAFLEDRSLLKREPPKNWVLKEQGWHSEFFLQFDDAVRIYQGMIETEPGNPDTHLSLGLVYVKQGRYDEALASLEKAHSLDQVYILGYLSAAKLTDRRRRHEATLRFLEAAESLAPEDPVILDALGTAHHNRGAYDRAVRYYRRVIDLGYDSPLTHAYLGDSYRLAGEPRRAAGAYQRAIGLHREHPDTLLPPVYWSLLGQALERAGETDGAGAVYREYLRLFSEVDPAETRAVQTRLERLGR